MSISAIPPILAPIFDSLPTELRYRDQWVGWSYETRDGKPTKLPKQVSGAMAESDEPGTWSDFATIKDAYPRRRWSGIGFVFAPDDPYAGIDFDGCRDPTSGDIHPWVCDWVKQFGSYAEVSPSQTGIKVIVYADYTLIHRVYNRNRQAKAGGIKEVEIYDRERYFALTGQIVTIEGKRFDTISDGQDALSRLAAGIFPAPRPKIERKPTTPSTLALTDTELLNKAFAAKNGGITRDLYYGSNDGRGDSEADYALCCRLAWYFGDDPMRLENVLRASSRNREKWDTMRGTETWIAGRIRRAIDSCNGEFYQPIGNPGNTSFRHVNKPPRPKLETEEGFGGEPDPDEADSLPVIVLTDRQDRNISADAWRAVHLANTPPQLFARGMGAACLARDTETKRVVVQQVDEKTMLHRLRRVANFVTVRKTKFGELETNTPPPFRIAEDMLLDGEQIGNLPVLRGVVNAPVIGPGGDLLATPGYHQSARLYVATDGLIVTVLDTPTKEDAQVAYNRLFGDTGIFGEFPYATDSDRANAAGLLFSLFLRPYIGGNVPMVLVEAPEKGTGKTLLAEAITSVFEPSIPLREAPTAGTRDEAQIEWRKVLTSALREAPTVLFFDNVQGVLASSALEALITAGNYTGRILGTAEQVTFNTDALTIVATSNNPEASEDMARRVNVIRLDAEMERPTDRKDFRIPDLKNHVRENRGVIIGDVLTILSAWLRAGAVQGKAHKASFERWALVLSGVLDFLDVPGFLENEEGFSTFLDPEKAKWVLFARRVFDTHGQSAKHAKELLDLAAEAEIINDTSDRGAARSLAKGLQKNRERVFDGLKLLGKSGQGGILRYSFRPVDGKPRANDAVDMGDLGKGSAKEGGFGGFGGFVSKPTRDPNIEANVKNKGTGNGIEETHQTHQTHPNDSELFFNDPFAPLDDNDAPPDPTSLSVEEEAQF